MAGLCKYSNSLGTPGEGAHALRAGGLAIVDILLTAGLAAVIARYNLRRVTLRSFLGIFALLIVLAVAVHEAFCVRTRLNAWVFGRPWPDPSAS